MVIGIRVLLRLYRALTPPVTRNRLVVRFVRLAIGFGAYRNDCSLKWSLWPPYINQFAGNICPAAAGHPSPSPLGVIFRLPHGLLHLLYPSLMLLFLSLLPITGQTLKLQQE